MQFASDLPGADPTSGMRMSIFQGYFQDDYRILPNLTINLGLRYEVGTSVTEVNGRMSNLINLTDTAPKLGAPYYNSPNKNFAPRVGFAWDPFKNGKTSIRGGAGIFDMLILPYNFQGRLTRSLPYFLGGTCEESSELFLPEPDPATGGAGFAGCCPCGVQS